MESSTICCKLAPTPEQAGEIDRALQAFADACNHAAKVCRSIDSTNKVEIQKECYHPIRAEFGLSANLTIRAIARACAALKVAEKQDSLFAPTSIDYDARIFSFREADWTFGVTLLSGREQFATVLGDFQREAMRGQHPTSATLVKRDGEYFLHVQVKEETPEPIVIEDVLGVDLGVVNLAVDSDGDTFSGREGRRSQAALRHTPAQIEQVRQQECQEKVAQDSQEGGSLPEERESHHQQASGREG